MMMRQDTNYSIEAFDIDGFSMGTVDRDTLKDAKEYARHMLTPDYANVIETERESIRVEVRDRNGEVVWDKSKSKLPAITIRYDSGDGTYFAAPNDNSGEAWEIEGAESRARAIKLVREQWNNPIEQSC